MINVFHEFAKIRRGFRLLAIAVGFIPFDVKKSIFWFRIVNLAHNTMPFVSLVSIGCGVRGHLAGTAILRCLKGAPKGQAMSFLRDHTGRSCYPVMSDFNSRECCHERI